MITKQLAEEIVGQTMIRLNHNLNVMDTNGMILASGDADRIERIHEGAAYVAKSKTPLWITEENLTNWHGTKPGVNMPVFFQEKLVGIIGITGNPEDLKEIATLVQLTTEMMVHQSLITSRVEWIRKLKELIFEELTSSEPPSPLVKERLSLLQFKETGPFVTLLIESNDFLPSPQRTIELLESHFEKDSVLIGHSQLNELFILSSGLDDSSLNTKIPKLFQLSQKNSSVRIGVGSPVETLKEVWYSYKTAKNALEFGPKDKQLIYFEDVELLALLKRNPQSEVQQFSKRILNGLSEDMLHTLTVYFACNTNSTTSAKTLDIHRHTLSHRLNKVKEITGYDPSIFKDAVSLNIALLLRDG